MNDDLTDLIKLAEAGKLMGDASKKTVQRRLTEAGTPLYQIGARTLVRRSDVQAYLESCRREPQPNTLKTLVANAVARAKARRAS